MQKLQVFISQTEVGLVSGLVRNRDHLLTLALFLEKTILITPPLPSSDAYIALATWEKRIQSYKGVFWRYYLKRKKQQALAFNHSFVVQEPLDDLFLSLKTILNGRLLSEQKLFLALRQQGFWPSDISQALDLGVYQGIFKQSPGFQNQTWGEKICSRCESKKVTLRPCKNCGRLACELCLDCASMGENRGCSTLFRLTEPSITKTRQVVDLHLSYNLTPAQQAASEELLDFWQGSEERALLWAACGAGKTEVVFPLIHRALSQGHSVLFAIPRQDIVREMAERLKKAFPQVTIAAHYGGQPWLTEAQLTVATTHQILQFYRRFELVVLDEVDAFPYHGNEMLRRALFRALTSQGRLVEMTATPYARRSYDRIITIPARYHGYPLPIPKLLTLKLPPWQELNASNLPAEILTPLQQGEHPWLVFVPTIAACKVWHQILSEVLAKKVGICHSKAEERVQTTEDFRTGKLDIVVTTSVLERGVNFSKVGVLVLHADHAVFSTSTLVQIAGRVGRQAESPQGEVLFIAERSTDALRQAQSLIQELNQEAKRKGLLLDELTP